MECEFKRREEDTGRAECMLGDGCHCALKARAEAAERRIAELEALVKRMAEGLRPFADNYDKRPWLVGSTANDHVHIGGSIILNKDLKQAAALVKEAQETK